MGMGPFGGRGGGGGQHYKPLLGAEVNFEIQIGLGGGGSPADK